MTVKEWKEELSKYPGDAVIGIDKEFQGIVLEVHDAKTNDFLGYIF